jgi:hypothetical protein
LFNAPPKVSQSFPPDFVDASSWLLGRVVGTACANPLLGNSVSPRTSDAAMRPNKCRRMYAPP